MPELGEGSSQPVRITEAPADVAMQVAILTERVAGLQQIINEREAAMRRALELQAEEYARRLDILNGTSMRVADVQARSVTVEKYDDYVASQRQALQLALGLVSEKIETGLTRGNEKVDANTTRIERLEAEERSRDKTEVRGEQRAGIVTQWQLAAMGAAVSLIITAVVIIANILAAKP